jgi:hypothetical protein
MQIHRAFLQLDELPRGPQVTLHSGVHQGHRSMKITLSKLRMRGSEKSSFTAQ